MTGVQHRGAEIDGQQDPFAAEARWTRPRSIGGDRWSMMEWLQVKRSNRGLKLVEIGKKDWNPSDFDRKGLKSNLQYH